MERILDAIEKARKERRNILVNEEARTPVDEIQETYSTYDCESGNEPVRSSSKSFEYSKTKKIYFTDDELKSKFIVGGFASDPRAEPYRNLRAHILDTMRKNGWKSLAITSPTSTNGTTLTAINLAICMSQEVNQTILLVDLNLRAPGIAKSFGINDIEKGIVDCALGRAELEETLINPGFKRLVIAPGTPQGHQTSEILSSPEMQVLQSELRNRYSDRFIIYDLPALLTSDDAMVFAPKADAVLMVVEDGAVKKDELKHSLKLLENANIIGTVANKLK